MSVSIYTSICSHGIYIEKLYPLYKYKSELYKQTNPSSRGPYILLEGNSKSAQR